MNGKIKKKCKKNLTFLIYALFIYGTQEKNKENLVISKLVCIFALRWLVKSHTGGHHQKVQSFFHIYCKNFLNIRIRWFPLLPLKGNLFKKKKKEKKKNLVFSKLVCIFAM